MQTIIDVLVQAGRSAIKVALYTLLPIMAVMRAEGRVVDGTSFMATIWYQTFKDAGSPQLRMCSHGFAPTKTRTPLHLGFTRRQMVFER